MTHLAVHGLSLLEIEYRDLLLHVELALGARNACLGGLIHLRQDALARRAHVLDRRLQAGDRRHQLLDLGYVAPLGLDNPDEAGLVLAFKLLVVLELHLQITVLGFLLGQLRRQLKHLLPKLIGLVVRRHDLGRSADDL